MTKRTKRILAMMSSKPKLRKISGLPPLTYTAKEEGTLKNYRIYGQTVDGESVGDRTANLFDEIYPDIDYYNALYKAIYVGVGIFTLRCDIPLVSGTTANLFLLSGNVSSGASSAVNGVSYGVPRSAESIDGYVTIGYRNFGNVDPRDYNVMLNAGSTALPYEPYGYEVSVTVEGKNLAKNNHADSSTLFTVEEVNNFIHVSGTNNSGSTKVYVISKENTFPAGSYDIVNNSDTPIGYDYKDENGTLVYRTVGANSIKTFNFPAVFTRYLNIYISVLNGESIDYYFQVMIVKHGDDTDTYEPCHAPITTPIYLPEPIKMVGDEAEYIEYGTQKMYRIGADDLDVTLPALPTVTGTNVLSVGTEVQPSEVEVTGRIRPVPTGGGE